MQGSYQANAQELFALYDAMMQRVQAQQQAQKQLQQQRQQKSSVNGMLGGMATKAITQPAPTANQSAALKSGYGPVNASYADTLRASGQSGGLAAQGALYNYNLDGAGLTTFQNLAAQQPARSSY